MRDSPKSLDHDTVPGLPAASYTLDLAELQSLTAVTHNVLWAVEARHLPYPSTGPYLGESFAATVNQPPVADAGDDLTTECTSPATSPVQLDASGSSDPDGDPLTHSWSAPGIDFDDSTSPTPTGEFPRGTHPVALTVSDGIQQNDDMVSVMVDDSTPPEISVVLTPSVLWPPNNTMQTITADVTVQDACDPDPEVILVSITSNEATDGDIQDAEFNHDDREFRLRAKRRGNGNGRIYTVVYRATDADGNHVDATAEVSVPHDRSGER